MWRLSNLLYRLFNRPQPGALAPTPEVEVIPKKLPVWYSTKVTPRPTPPRPRYTPPQRQISDNDSDSTVDAALAAAVLAHSLRFDPQPERFTPGGGTFGGAGASGSWDSPADEPKSTYTPSSSYESSSSSSSYDSSSSDSSSSSSSSE